jgi:hypothetical protein
MTLDYANMKKRLELMYSNEDGVADAWNKFVEEQTKDIPLDQPRHIHKIYRNTPTNVLEVAKSLEMAEDIFFNTLISGQFDVNHRYFYAEGCEFVSINSIYTMISISEMEKFYKDTFSVWKERTKNAITLWNDPYEEVKVEITSQYVKFYRRDDILSCYTYRPLNLLKNDKEFIRYVKDMLIESCQYIKCEFENWLSNNCDLPPFPISVIFTSDYPTYIFEEIIS